MAWYVVRAHLALLGDKRFLFSDSGETFLMFGVRGRSWIAMGPPVGKRCERLDLLWRFRELADAHARQPGDDLISGLVTDTGPHAPMSRGDLLSTCGLLLVAGHETTVNLITNGMLTLLRHPGVLDRLNHEPGLIITLVEELLRYEGPSKLMARWATEEVELRGRRIARSWRRRSICCAGASVDSDATLNVSLSL